MNTAFAERLTDALQRRGITTTRDKIDRLRATTGRSARTAERWLSGRTQPRNGATLAHIAFALNVDAYWLYDGRPPSVQHIAAVLQTLPRELVAQFARFVDRLEGNDPEIVAALERFKGGEIDARELVAMA